MKIQHLKGLWILLVSFMVTSNFILAQDKDSTATVEGGLKLANEKKFQEAITVFERCVKQTPENADIYYYLGNAYLDLLDFNNAIKQFSQTIAFNANYSDAITDYETVLKYTPSLHEVQFDLGNAYFSVGNFEKALSFYDQAITLNNSYSNYYFNRAITEYNLGFPEDACADFNNAKDLGDKEVEGYMKELCK